jgi:hypothetical protein
MKFGDDWTGVFIRGDDAHNFAVYLDQILDPHRQEKLSTTERAVLEGLLSDLRATDERQGPHADLQRLQAWEACLPVVPIVAEKPEICGGCSRPLGPQGCDGRCYNGRAP